MALLLLTGCGSRSGTVGSGGTQQDRASMQATSVVLVRRWVEVIYNLAPPSAGAVSCPYQRMDSTLPDGSRVVEVTDERCVQWKQTLLPDRRTILEYRFPDGRAGTATIDPARALDRNRLLLHVEQEYSNGDRVRYDRIRDTRGTPTDARDDTTQWRGEIHFLRLQDQGATEFTLLRTMGEDALEMTLPDGARFTLNVPLQTGNLGAQVPRFGEATEGSYASGGQRLEFALRGAEAAEAWDQWTLTASDGTTGRFVLYPDFSGGGQFYRDGQIDSRLSWDRNGTVAVTLVTGDATTAGPSAAALEFLADVWRALFATASPAPLVR